MRVIISYLRDKNKRMRKALRDEIEFCRVINREKEKRKSKFKAIQESKNMLEVTLTDEIMIV